MATAAIPATVYKDVTIQGPIAYPDAVEISKLAKHQVRWNSDTACIVKFLKGSPFGGTEFYVPKQGVCSGQAGLAAKVCTKPGCTVITHEGHYKYTITDTAGKVLADPQIIIKP